jgi:hypothetical protein
MMLLIASAMSLASFQTAAADAARKEFVACLHDVVDKARGQKITADGFVAFAHAQCGSIETNFKSGMVGFDVKNKVPRKQAESDAQSSIDDYVSTADERFKASLPQ